MNLVDSSGWLEYFADGPKAKYFQSPIHDTRRLIVPTISLYEVFKKVLLEFGEDKALQAIALMEKAKVIDLDLELSLKAAKLSHQLKLPMADSIILATARMNDAMLWTKDADFKGMLNVRYLGD